jgi:hypothetical protein
MYDLQLQNVILFLGIRPVALGTMSVWEALQDSALDQEQTSTALSSLSRSVAGLTAQIGAFRSPDALLLDPSFQRTLGETVQKLVSKAMLLIRQSLLDFAALFWQNTTKPGPLEGPSVPGDILEARLRRLEQPSINLLGVAFGERPFGERPRVPVFLRHTALPLEEPGTTQAL